MDSKFKKILYECYKKVKINPQDIKAKQTLNILYLDYWRDHTEYFDYNDFEEENRLLLLKYQYLLDIVDEIRKKEDLCFDYESSIKLSNDDIFELLYDFFKNGTNEYFFNIFLQIYKNKDKNILIYRDLDVPFLGESHFYPHNNNYKCIICMDPEFNDYDYIPIIAHEMGHAIEFLSNFHPDLYYINSNYIEIVSMFFDMICNYYFSNTFKNEALSYAIYNDNLIRCFSDFIINPESYKVAINTLPYVIGKSIALEIFMIYMHDKDEALYLIKKIIEIPKFIEPVEYYKRILNLGIIPNKALDKYENILKRKLKT